MSKGVIRKIERLVGSVADELGKDGVNTEERIEGLRVLGPYYKALVELKAKRPDEPEEDDVTMSGLQEEMRRVEQGDRNGKAVHRRSRGRRADRHSFGNGDASDEA